MNDCGEGNERCVSLKRRIPKNVVFVINCYKIAKMYMGNGMFNGATLLLQPYTKTQKVYLNVVLFYF